jgi:hypothetical protein
LICLKATSPQPGAPVANPWEEPNDGYYEILIFYTNRHSGIYMRPVLSKQTFGSNPLAVGWGFFAAAILYTIACHRI